MCSLHKSETNLSMTSKFEEGYFLKKKLNILKSATTPFGVIIQYNTIQYKLVNQSPTTKHKMPLVNKNLDGTGKNIQLGGKGHDTKSQPVRAFFHFHFCFVLFK